MKKKQEKQRKNGGGNVIKMIILTKEQRKIFSKYDVLETMEWLIKIANCAEDVIKGENENV